MQLSTKELDVIEILLMNQGTSISEIQKAVHIDNECGGQFDFDVDYEGDSIYEVVVLYYWNLFKGLFKGYHMDLKYGYYDYLYNSDNVRDELQNKINSLNEEQIILLSNIPYVRYFVSKFNLDLNI